MQYVLGLCQACNLVWVHETQAVWTLIITAHTHLAICYVLRSLVAWYVMGNKLMFNSIASFEVRNTVEHFCNYPYSTTTWHDSYIIFFCHNTGIRHKGTIMVEYSPSLWYHSRYQYWLHALCPLGSVQTIVEAMDPQSVPQITLLYWPKTSWDRWSSATHQTSNRNAENTKEY